MPDISQLSDELQAQAKAIFKNLKAENKSGGEGINVQIEKLADFLNQNGLHDESRGYYLDICKSTNSILDEVRVKRKIAETYLSQRNIFAACQASEDALQLIRQAGSGEEKMKEFFETLSACAYANYFVSKSERLQELVTEMRSHFPSISDEAVKLRFYFVVMLGILLRNRWYMLPEETITHGEYYLQIALGTGNWNTIASAYCGQAFNHLWREEPELCRKNFELGFNYLQNRNYDLLLTAQVYTAVSYRMQNNVSMCEKWAVISRELAVKSNNKDYLGLTYGNLAWVFAKRNNLLYAEEFARKGLELCMPISTPMLYLCIFPLLKCLVAYNKIEEAGRYAYLLLHPTLKGFPKSLNQRLTTMNEAWVKQNPDTKYYLEDVITEAELTNYF